MRLRVASVVLVAVSLALFLGPDPAGAATPAVTGFSPGSGPVGAKVVITGTGFSPKPVTVQFNGVTSASPKVNAAGTKVTAFVPPFATSGPIRVYTATGQFADSADPFTVTFGATLSPKVLFTGQKMRISGSAYPPYSDVSLSINGTTPLGGGATDANGNFSVVRTIPDIPPGQIQMLDLDCVSAVCDSAFLPFSLFSDWPQTRYHAGQSGFNDAEWRVDTGDVSTMHRRYDETGCCQATAPMVEKGGRLFLGSGFNNAGQLLVLKALANGGFLWSANFGRPVTGIAVDGDVAYAVTWDTLYAFDAKGVTNCNGGTCLPLWTAPLSSTAYPFPPVVAFGKVFVGEFGTQTLAAFDAAGTTNCSGNPKACTPLWSVGFNWLHGPPAVSGGGRLFVSIRTNTGANKVAVYDEYGGFVTQSAALGGTQLSGPALSEPPMSSGTVAVTVWNAGNTTATLDVLDALTMTLGWTSPDLGGLDVASMPAVNLGRAFVANSSGRLLAFKLAGCGAATCDPLWTSQALGTGNSVAPIVANGVVYHAAGANVDSNGLAHIYALDAAGNLSCSGTPKVCTPLADIVRGSTGQQGSVGNPGGMLMTAGNLYGVGGDGYTAFVR